MTEFEKHQVESAERIAEIERVVKDSVVQSYFQQVRTDVLWVFAFIGIGVGLSMFTFGEPTTFYPFALNSEIKYSFATVPLLGGLVIGWGLYKGRKSIIWESVGLTMLGVWFGLMWTGFLMAFGKGVLENPYPVVVYFGLSVLIMLHILTIAKFIAQPVRINGR